MKNKIYKKLISCVAAGAMAVSMLAGCGSTTSDAPAEDSTDTVVAEDESVAADNTDTADSTIDISYPMESGNTLTIAYVSEAAVTANYKDISETPFWAAWEEKTGVDLEVIEVGDNTAMNLLFAGGELPDVVIFNFASNYTGGVSAAIEDGIIQVLDDYMDYAPDLQAVLDSNELYKNATISSEGNIIGFPFVRGDDYLLTSYGLVMRADWLEDLNMEVPETPDELYTVLKAFQTEKGADVAFSIGNWALNKMIKEGAFSAGYGLPRADFYQVDGTVHFGFYEEGFKDTLAFLNKLYEENLLDHNFQTLDNATMNSNILEGKSGMTAGAVGSGIGTWLSDKADDPTYDLVGVGPLTTERGTVSVGGGQDFPVNGVMAVVTRQCDNIEAAVQFLNYGYTEEGNLFFNYGVEGESYTMVDGVPTYTDFIMNNPDGWSKQQALAAYTRSWANGPFVQEKGYMEQYSNLPQQIEAINRWTNTTVGDHVIPNVTIALEDADEFSSLSSEITTYIEEMTIKYITGLISLDTFETEYLATLKEMGVERYIELKQNALNEYNAR